MFNIFLNDIFMSLINQFYITMQMTIRYLMLIKIQMLLKDVLQKDSELLVELVP